MKKIRRREFLSTSAKAAAITVIPRHVLGGPGYMVPSDRLNIACIGNGTQGTRVMLSLLKMPELRIIAVADPVKDDTRYQNWGQFELRNNIRRSIEEPQWDEGISGCRAGREPAKRIVEKWYSKQTNSGKYKGCHCYEDYRELLEKVKDIDAVVVGATDHQHAQVAIQAMQKGKHVLCQKPMTNSVYEARLLAETARKAGLATQVHTANSSAESTDKLCEMVWSGVIGPVRQVYNWSNRPVWLSGFTELPPEEPVPEGFNWDLWLGPAKYRPFSYQYTHTTFRSWYEFGTGALGDMGCYSFDVIYRVLKLGAPLSVQAYGSTDCVVKNSVPTFIKPVVSHPKAMTAHFSYPARGEMPPVEIFWSDGGIKPLLPEELEKDGKVLSPDGMMLVGDYGKIIAAFHGSNPRLIPEDRNKTFTPPPPTIERSGDHIRDWINACKGGKQGRANFEFAAPLTEALNLAIIAMRTEKKLYWDADKMLTNSDDANKLIKPEYRQGYEL